MFIYKVSIYLKSGNVVYIKMKELDFYRGQGNEILLQKSHLNSNIILTPNCIEAIVIKKWWQQWG